MASWRAAWRDPGSSSQCGLLLRVVGPVWAETPSHCCRGGAGCCVVWPRGSGLVFTASLRGVVGIPWNSCAARVVQGISSTSTDSHGGRCASVPLECLPSPEATPHPLAVPPHFPWAPRPLAATRPLCILWICAFWTFRVTMDLCSARSEHLEAHWAGGRAQGFAPMAVGPHVDLLSLLISCVLTVAGWFPLCAPVNPARVNIHAPVCVQTWVFPSLGCRPVRGLAGSDGDPARGQPRSSRTAFRRGRSVAGNSMRLLYPQSPARQQLCFPGASQAAMVWFARPSRGTPFTGVPGGRVYVFFVEVSARILCSRVNGIVCLFAES